MYATDRRQTDVWQKHRLIPAPMGGDIINKSVRVARGSADINLLSHCDFQ